MANALDHDDTVALLKHYEIGVADGHVHSSITITLHGGKSAEADQVLTATVGAHSAQRICPVTDFLARGMVGELADPLLNNAALGRAIAHLIEKASRMHVESHLVRFSLTAALDGDHYEVLAKSASIEPSHETKIPHRLAPHAHDRSGFDSAAKGARG